MRAALSLKVVLLVSLILMVSGALAQFPTYRNNPATVTAEKSFSWLRPNSAVKQCAESMAWNPTYGLIGGDGETSVYPNEIHNDMVCTMWFLDGLGQQQAHANQLMYTIIFALGVIIILVAVKLFVR